MARRFKTRRHLNPVTFTMLVFDGSGAPMLELGGPAGGSATLQWSADLANWNDAGTVTVGDTVTDSARIGEKRRFYRLLNL